MLTLPPPSLFQLCSPQTSCSRLPFPCCPASSARRTGEARSPMSWSALVPTAPPPAWWETHWAPPRPSGTCSHGPTVPMVSVSMVFSCFERVSHRTVWALNMRLLVSLLTITAGSRCFVQISFRGWYANPLLTNPDWDVMQGCLFYRNMKHMFLFLN